MSKRSESVAGAGGVVFNPNGEVLVLGHRGGAWMFPKGHIDPGELAHQAALREVEEEAGVQGRIVDVTQVEITRYSNDKGVRRKISWFLMRTEALAPVLREATFPKGGFFPPVAALEQLSFDEDKELLKTMLERLSRVAS